MERSANVIYFVCVFVYCNAAEIPRAFSSSARLQNDSSIRNSSVQDLTQPTFQKRDESVTPMYILSHTNTKWSPWTPVPNSYKQNSSLKQENLTKLEQGNETGISGNTEKLNATVLHVRINSTTSNSTNHTYSITAAHKNANDSKTTTPETKKSMPVTLHRVNHHASYSKGMTYYFWDTIYMIFKCFKDHWTNGVVDCVTARASTLLDGILGFGGNRRHHQLLNKEGYELIPYDELQETPRDDKDALPLEEDEAEEEEEEEEELYDDIKKDSREDYDDDDDDYNDSVDRRKKIRKNNRHMKLLTMAIITIMIPILLAVKLKYFIMMSLGLGALGLVIGKTVMFSMLAFPAAVLSSYHRREPHGYWRRRTPQKSAISRYGNTIDPLAGGRRLR